MSSITKSGVSSLRLEPLQADDVPRCVEIYFAAFQNAHSLACWPRGIPTVRKFWEDMLYDEMKDPDAVFLKVVAAEDNQDIASSQGAEEVMAFAKWVKPKATGVEVDTGLPEWPEGADAELCKQTFGEWAREHHNLMGTRSHWCKSYFCGLCFGGSLADMQMNSNYRS